MGIISTLDEKDNFMQDETQPTRDQIEYQGWRAWPYAGLILLKV